MIPYPTARAEHALRTRLFALGYSEAISSTFASAAESAFFAPGTPAVALENPLSEEAANLRPSLLPGMVTMLAHNLNRDVLTARLFEAGAVFAGSAAQVEERLSLSLGLTGTVPATPLHSAADAPFFELKGVLESVLSLFDLPLAEFTRTGVPASFEPSRSAAILLGGKPLAVLGQFSAAEAARRKLRQPGYLAELDLSALLAYPLRQTTAHELSRFQAVERDFSFTFRESTEWKTIAAAVNALAIPEMQSLAAIEVFRDPKKMPGQFSMLIRTVFQSPERTLTEEDLTAWSTAVIHALEGLGGILRKA